MSTCTNDNSPFSWRNSSCPRVVLMTSCMRSLLTNFIHTRRRGPSTCTIRTSSSRRCSCSYIHSWIYKADILGLFGSKTHTVVSCRSHIFMPYPSVQCYPLILCCHSPLVI